MTRNEIAAHNAGIAAMAGLAAASSDALRLRLTATPTRFSFAIEALDAIVEAAHEVMLPLQPNGAAAAAVAGAVPKPPAPAPASRAVDMEARNA